jgi:hypothetical protein
MEIEFPNLAEVRHEDTIMPIRYPFVDTGRYNLIYSTPPRAAAAEELLR